MSDRTRQLAVVLDGGRIGTVVEDAGGYRLTYEAGYRRDLTVAADAFLQAAWGETVTALRSDLPTRLVDRVAARAKACREALAQR